MSEITITEENFKKEVLESDVPVLVDFWATWCGPCKMLAPIIEEVANEKAGSIKVGKVNVDEQEKLAMLFGVASIPTLVVFKNGQAVSSSIGYCEKEHILKLLEQ